MKLLKHCIAITILFTSFLTPQVAFAQTNSCEDGLFKPLVVCGRTSTSACGQTEPCKLSDAFTVFGNIVQNIIILLLILTPIYIMYIGIQMILQHGVPKQLAELKMKLIWSVIYLIIIFGSWLIIREIVNIFNVSSDVPSFLLNQDGTPTPNPGPSIR